MFREIIGKGGLVMYPLLICSITALAVSLERAVYFARIRRAEKGLREKINTVRHLISAGEVAKATGVLQGGEDPLTRVYLAGLAAKEPERALQDTRRAAQAERRQLFSGLPVLDTIVTAAPLLGLLGTVTGILRTFRIMGTGAVVLNMQEVGKGIAEALITTATGLVIAIPTLVVMNYFMHRALAINESLDCEVTEFWDDPTEWGDNHAALEA